MKKKILCILILVLISGCVQEQQTTTTSTSTSISSTTTSTSSTTSTTIRETGHSIKHLVGCRKTESIGEFLNFTGYPVSENFQDSLDNIKAVEHDLPQNINAKIYQVPVGIAGGDVLKVPVVKTEEKYCKFNRTNAQVIFAPIEKKDAIDYLELMYITLSQSQYGRDHIVIRKKQQYNELADKCPAGNLTEIENKKTSQVEETEQGYQIEMITQNNAGQSCIFEWNATISRQGKIQIYSINCTIPCGNMILY